MSTQKKLSLLSAIFINLNVMIGTGIFINTYNLSAQAGAAGFLLYPMVGLCILPLIAVIGQLVKLFPTGGLYGFAQSYSKYLGFLSCWSYFFGKLASACVMLTVATTMFQQLIPSLQPISPIAISLSILGFFTLLNLQNMKTSVMVQSFFLTSKSIPILFAIVAGILYCDTTALATNQFMWTGMPLCIPLVLYCLAGFETACALGRNIENPSVNGPKAVYYSFGIIMMLYGIFQACIYINSYQILPFLTGYEGIFPAIAHKIFYSELIAHKVALLLSFAIGSSALGGAYGILFANSWNLYTLAEHNHTIGSNIIKQLNRHNTPWIAVLIESLVCTLFLLFNQGSVLPLQRTATLGIIIAYTVSAFAYYQLVKQSGAWSQNVMLSCAAFITCLIFVASCATSFMQTGLAPLMLFIIILVAGSSMFYYKKSKTLYK